MKNVKRIIQVAYHRNGVSGEGFHAVRFEADEVKGEMVAIVFKEPYHCAVLNVEMLSDPECGVKFGANSWRGDRYERELREAIAAWDELPIEEQGR